MITRVGDVAQQALLMRALQATQGRMRETQMAVASGKRERSFDGMAAEVPRLLSTRFDRTRNDAHIRQNEHVIDRMQAMDGALESLGRIAERARSLLVQRLNDGIGEDVPLDTELESMLREVEARLNTRLDGRYLFAGSRTDTRPVTIPDPPPTTADSSLYYAGDDLELEVAAEEGVELAYGIPASDSAFEWLVGALGLARQGHLANDTDDLETALDNITIAIERLADLRGELGAKRDRLETIVEVQKADKVYFDEMVSDIEDTDLSAALSRLAQDRTALEASYLAVSRLSQLSIADYLR
ncbi:MAG TPA: hypothetical protein ENJ38_12660 [Rhodospirillales bacterium]|nr:hypothetical protein [Rhodospirillales bacterium]